MDKSKKALPIKWNDDEESKLLTEVKIHPMSKIAELHNRSVNAIYLRLCKIGAEMKNKDKIYEEIINTLKYITKEDIEKYIASEDNKKKIKQDTKEKKNN